MATERRAETTWEGDLRSGHGRIENVGSGAFGGLDVAWASRAEKPDERTSPEELIAAAHASCFSMALSNVLAQQGSAPERLDVSATVTFVAGTGITRSALDVTARVPGIEEGALRAAAEQAKEDCPVSKALAGNVELSVDARLAP